jgi:probable addiction module antidote protein
VSIKLSEFNPFERFETQKEKNQFLMQCYEDDDPNTFVTALGFLAKHQGMTEVAKAAGLSRESLYRTFNGKTQPRWDTIQRLLRVLGVQLTIAA